MTKLKSCESGRLAAPKAAGIVNTRACQARPKRSEHEMTEKNRARLIAAPALQTICCWTSRYIRCAGIQPESFMQTRREQGARRASSMSGSFVIGGGAFRRGGAVTPPQILAADRADSRTENDKPEAGPARLIEAFPLHEGAIDEIHLSLPDWRRSDRRAKRRRRKIRSDRAASPRRERRVRSQSEKIARRNNDQQDSRQRAARARLDSRLRIDLRLAQRRDARCIDPYPDDQRANDKSGNGGGARLTSFGSPKPYSNAS